MLLACLKFPFLGVVCSP